MSKKSTKKSTEKKWASATGQTGPVIEVSYDSLNHKEKKVLAVLDAERKGTRPLMGIQDIGDAAFKRESKARRNSWVRNSLRRLVRAEFVEHGEEKGDGTYRITEKGRKRVLRALSEASAAPKRSKTVSASHIQPEQTVETPAQESLAAEVVAEPLPETEPADLAASIEPAAQAE